jgi:uncharacterized protein YggE
MRRILLTILLGLTASGLAHAVEPARTVSVAGQGKVSVPPDIVFIRTGVTTESSEAQTALAENTAAMNRILALLQELGIAEYDISTTNFSVMPITKREKLNSSTTFVGYRVDNQLRARLADVAQLGEILDALVAAGSNRVSGIEFALDDPGGALDEARKLAIADARARAELYANSAGVRIGSVISISEQGAQVPRPQRIARTMALDQASAVPIARGTHEVQANVTVVYSLLD